MSAWSRQRNAAARGRSTPCLEVLVAIAALLLLNVHAVPESLAYEGWTVNPYLAVVVIASVRYGTAVGLWAALCGTVAFLVSAGHQVASADALSLFPRGHALPVWLIAAALTCGPAIDRWAGWLGELIRAHDASEEKLARLSMEYTLLADEKHLLDKQVLSEEDTFETLIALFGELDDRPARELPQHVTALATRVLGGGRAALYQFPRARDGALGTPALVHGEGEWPQALDAAHPLLARALAGPDAVALPHLAGWMTVEAVRREAIHVACAVGGVLAKSRLLVVARDVPLTGFSRARLRALTLATTVVGKTLRRTRSLAGLHASASLTAALLAESRRSFRARVRRAVRQARRHARQVQVISVRLAQTGDHALTGPLVRAVRHALNQPHGARAFVHAARPGHVLAVCTMTRDAAAAAVVADLRTQLAARLWPGPGANAHPRVRVASLRVDSDDMLFRDPQTAHRPREVLVLRGREA